MTATPVGVMLADDHDAILRGVRGVIENSGRYKVLGEAREGRDAYKLACDLKPAVAVIDYSLPGMNGLDLSRAIKRACPETEILLFTMHDQVELIWEVLRAGVRGYIVKSDPAEHLILALDALSAGQPYFSPTVSDAVLERILQDQPAAKGRTLTQKEREVVQLIAEGQQYKEIASKLDVNIKTVESHRSTAVRKLGLRTTADLVRWALRTNLVAP